MANFGDMYSTPGLTLRKLCKRKQFFIKLKLEKLLRRLYLYSIFNSIQLIIKIQNCTHFQQLNGLKSYVFIFFLFEV